MYQKLPKFLNVSRETLTLFRRPPNLPTAARRNRKCTECGTTTFCRNRMSAESAHFSTFGAETETEAEIRSTSTENWSSLTSVTTANVGLGYDIRTLGVLYPGHFYARQHNAIARICHANSSRPSVRRRPSHACIVSKRLNVSSKFYHCLIGSSF